MQDVDQRQSATVIDEISHGPLPAMAPYRACFNIRHPTRPRRCRRTAISAGTILHSMSTTFDKAAAYLKEKNVKTLQGPIPSTRVPRRTVDPAISSRPGPANGADQLSQGNAYERTRSHSLG